MSVGATWYVYILQCADGSYYVGHTVDLRRRVHAHNGGGGSTYTFKRRPVSLAYSEIVATEAAAVARERQLKGWSRAKKKALIDGDASRLKRLSKSRERRRSDPRRQ